MPRTTSKRVPDGAELVASYAKLNQFLGSFRDRTYNLLIVLGYPGVGKSEAIKHHLKDAQVVEGSCTAYAFYQALYEHWDEVFVLDDCNLLTTSLKSSVDLLKVLTDHREAKEVQWRSNTAEIRDGVLPRCFPTKTRLIIVGNQWASNNPDVRALESRGHLLYFAPPVAEVHRYVGTWFQNPEVYDYIGERLDRFIEPDIRVYTKAAQRVKQGDWKEYVESLLVGGDEAVALTLLQTAEFRSDNERAKEFARLIGSSTRTFYRIAKRVRGASAIP